MSSFGDFLENELLDHVWGNAAYAAPATLYLALSTSDPLDDGSGITEPAGGSYARLGVANNATNWPAASGGSKSNGQDFTFVTATASWGVISHMAIFDAGAGGNMLAHANLTTSKTIDNGDTVIFETGNLTITLD
jgi:hypothetical protein